MSDKRWIKIGAVVSLKTHPELKMMVDNVARDTKEVVGPLEGDSRKVEKTFTLGVDCHWLDTNNRYCKGRFHTYELQPHVDRES
jgi:uncharacterized protein YodC (DUF2158 family)